MIHCLRVKARAAGHFKHAAPLAVWLVMRHISPAFSAADITYKPESPIVQTLKEDKCRQSDGMK